MEQYISQNKEFFSKVEKGKEDKRAYSRFITYFSHYSDIKKVSSKLAKPDILVSTDDPIVLETQAFDIKWSQNPFPAGFHSWYCNSLQVNNVFAERIRYDKSTTTDYETIYKIARNNTVKLHVSKK